MLKITGNQYRGKDSDRIEFITSGTLSTDGKITYISYDETELSGMYGYKTNLTIEPDSITMSRSSDDTQATIMCFEKGRRYHGIYSTPYGSIGMELLTNDVTGYMPDGEIDKLLIDYDISLKGLSESRNTLEIEIIGEPQ